jgi:hypothetical protein
MHSGIRLPNVLQRKLKMDDSKQIFNMILDSLSLQATNEKELMILWLSIGKKLGVEEVIKNFRVVSAEKNDQGDQSIIGIVGATSKDALDFLTSDLIWNESLVADCLSEVKEIVIH